MSDHPIFFQTERMHLARIKALSRLALIIEHLGESGWRLACWCMGFGALWLFEIPHKLGGAFAALGATLFLLGAIYFTYKDVRFFRWPRCADIQRRIESASGVTHRPLSTLEDRPVNTPTDGLWAREQQRQFQMLAALRPVWPNALLATRDPRALRGGLFIALVCGLFVAGPDWDRRIVSGLLPIHALGLSIDQRPQIAFWVSPPEYTEQSRILPGSEDEILHIPQGSLAKALVPQNTLHFLRKPALIVDGRPHALEAGQEGMASLEMEIPVGKHLRLRTGLWGGEHWEYSFIPDLIPSIGTAGDSKALPDGQIQFPLTMMDDYGVKSLHMRMTLDPRITKAPIGWPVQEERSVQSPPRVEFQMAPVYDLSAHPWAGLPVVFVFSAHDDLDQIAQTPPLKVMLPERQFTHPLARQLIEIRKYLIWNPENPYREAGLQLERLLYQPQSYGHDVRVFLSLRVASSRLYYNAPSESIARSVISLLWDTALRLEDGNFSLAARDLREIQKELEKALQDPNVNDAELAMMIERLRDAMTEYLQALAREWQKAMESGEIQQMQWSPEVLAQMMNMNDLAGIMDQMQQDMLSGDRNSAREMLSKLQRMLDMANPSMRSTMPPDMQAMQEALEDLQDLIERQEALRVKTAEQTELYNKLRGLGVDGTSNKTHAPFIDTKAGHEEQNKLLTMLQQIIEDAELALEGLPENFRLAAQAMSGSIEQLDNVRPDLSLPLQDEAIAHLKDAQQKMAQMMSQRMQQMTGLSISGMPMQMDPLGRPYRGQDGENGPPFGSQVKVPGEAEKKWVLDILNELRRRASDRSRPQEELDYYRRLLRRF